MTERKEYVVLIHDLPHTMLLDEEHARRYGDQATEVKAAQSANKSRKPANKAAGASEK